MSRLKALRYYAGAIKRRLNPTPEEAAWRQMCRAADHVPRHEPGHIRVLDYDLEYVDLLSTCPQWEDLFVRAHQRFTAAPAAPRILDCGANIGLATLAFKRQYPRARVTAFEADPVIAAVLERNLTRNGAGDVERVAAAVWIADGTVEFSAEGSDSGAIGEVPGLPSRRIVVPAVRLRDWLVREPIDLLKIDIEGAELAVLQDCEDALGQVKAIHVEVHDLAPGRRLLPACLTLLERAGFTTALSGLLPVTWRSFDPQGSPFADAMPRWVVVLRAWRPQG
jgi:FkbM family methyltransferase